MRRASAAPPRRRDPLTHHRVPSPPPELEALVLSAAAEAASAALQPDWAARLWASTAARMLWAATICALLLGHTLANRPLPGVVLADDTASARALATLLDLPAHSFATIAAAMRRLPGWETSRAATLASRNEFEAILEETGG